MRDPYLLLGIKLTTAAPEHLGAFEQMMKDLETILEGIVLTELKMPGIYAAELPSGSSRALWRKVAQLLSDVDDEVGDDLQWFAHLADRRGCELAFN